MDNQKPPPEFVNWLYPISQFEMYPNDCLITKRASRFAPKNVPRGTKRGKVEKMSSKSIARLAFVVTATEVAFESMITLTYGEVYPTDGKESKVHLGKIINWLRDAGICKSYLWFLEFQQRGAPHYHILIDQDVILPKWRAELALKWLKCSTWNNSAWRADYAPDGQTAFDEKAVNAYQNKVFSVCVHPRTWERVHSPNGARRYALKYCASALKQKEVPEAYQNCGRFWGHSLDVKPKSIRTIDTTDDELREYLAMGNHPAQSWDIIPKFIFGVNRRVVTET